LVKGFISFDAARENHEMLLSRQPGGHTRENVMTPHVRIHFLPGIF